MGVLAICTALMSCGPAATSGGFDSPNPAAKMYAIESAARQGDRSAVRRIVEQLDSDDPAVRSLAIAALQRLTGETFGYRDFDPPDQRRLAIQRWRQAIQENHVPVHPSGANDSGQSQPESKDPAGGAIAHE